MKLKKTIWIAVLCTGFIGGLSVSSTINSVQTVNLVAAVNLQEAAPLDKGPHVLPPF
ncbi:hypothetical protein [Planomicrobium sp. CPCC 101079]|uniref:hypothetical protein n=1 Tax=Planomicrobium sp. CPCC 101079 TaxID=2599618 RepID=UPI0016484012|nr:hypothetical protein [Planomicrobium sp. CPCC 101079]